MIFLEGALADRDLWLFSVRLNWFQASRFCLFSVAWLGSTKDIHCFFESEKRGIIFPMAWKQTLHRAPVPLISIRLIWNEHKTWRLFQHLYSFFFSFFLYTSSSHHSAIHPTPICRAGEKLLSASEQIGSNFRVSVFCSLCCVIVFRNRHSDIFRL